VKAVVLEGIGRRYGAVEANRGVSLSVEAGTVHAIVGENGAGKSTLMRILAGVERADAGTVQILGQPLTRPDPLLATRLGLGMVHQHFKLVETFTVAENLVLGHEPLRGGLLDRAAAAQAVLALSTAWGLPVRPDARVEDLSVGEKQRVEILRVLYQGARVLVLDEPTAVLAPPEVRRLLEMLRRFVEDPASPRTVLLVTHKLDQVMAVADRVTVMRRGEVVAELAAQETTPAALAHAMVGRPVELTRPLAPRPPVTAPPLLTLEGVGLVAGGRVLLEGLDLTLRPGEILGVAGVMGNGQSELLEIVAGLRRATSGALRLAGADLQPLSVAERLAAGIAHVPEDRGERGLVMPFSIEENLALGALDRFSGRWSIHRAALRQHALQLLARFDVRPPDPTVPAGALSGGNAQKVVMGREISRSPRLLLCGQPTRGVDIGAVELIHRELRQLRDQGVAILLVSADLSELRALSDRLIVLHRGRVSGRLDAAEATPERLGELMTGLHVEGEGAAR
jgi:simple sugar transport system ATP-binding protein